MNVTARLTFLVDTDSDAGAIEGSAYAAGGWVHVERRPAMLGGGLPALVIVTWDHRTPDEALEDISMFLPRHIKPL